MAKTEKLAEAEGQMLRCPASLNIADIVVDTIDDVDFIEKRAKELGVKIEFVYDTGSDPAYDFPVGMKAEAQHLF